MKIGLFAGTNEGREIAEYICRLGYDEQLLVYTATDYGAGMLRNVSHIQVGRLDSSMMAGEFLKNGFGLVIDATHPYADRVSRNVMEALGEVSKRGCHPEYIRVERPRGRSYPAARHTDSVEEAVRLLSDTDGNILLTTGTRDIACVTALPGYRERVYVRMLPDPDNISRVLSHGFLRDRLICMHGPFSLEMNRLIMREKHIRYMLTKESGAAGGFDEKMEAAFSEGCIPIVIKRPEPVYGGMDLSAAFERIRKFLGCEKKAESCYLENPGTEAGRRGMTTGSCAALAAGAAAYMALTGERREWESLITPGGEQIGAHITDIEMGPGFAQCGVVKYAGDDPDVTDGCMIRAKVTSSGGRQEIEIAGGEGIGVVTRPGLSVAVGEKAINPVPREMIRAKVFDVLEELDHPGGCKVEISVPGGREIAGKTFNGFLGIEGGISILGTTGIVEPMSREAFIRSIEVQADIIAAEGRSRIIFTPGNIGMEMIRELWDGEPDMDMGCVVRCGNYIGQALLTGAKRGFEQIVLAGHMGKLVKVAAGIMNTHSAVADGRMEVIAAHAALAGADSLTVGKLMECSTTLEAADILRNAGITREVMSTVTGAVEERMRKHLLRGGYEGITVRAVIFS